MTGTYDVGNKSRVPCMVGKREEHQSYCTNTCSALSTYQIYILSLFFFFHLFIYLSGKTVWKEGGNDEKSGIEPLPHILKYTLFLNHP
ncbi:hypothetical protein S83_020368 [Arachis hypogaea]